MSKSDAEWREGPPVYYVCVCVRRRLDFIGGPIGYELVEEGELLDGPIVIEDGG